ncbi:DUF2250 domain-containing protein [Desulforamulus ruminis]
MSDEIIWERALQLIRERDEIYLQMARPGTAQDPQRMKELSIKLHELNPLCLLIEELKSQFKNYLLVQELLTLGDSPGEEELQWQEEYQSRCQQLALQVYRALLDKGCLEEEVENPLDLEILKFIEYAGPEYAWRLSINVNITVEKARECLEKLLWKGLLERVPGNMLGNYHRQKDWTKHMNHTYYRITREGRLYLRQLRREQEEQMGWEEG